MLLEEVSAPLLHLPCVSALLTRTLNSWLPSHDGIRSGAGCHAPTSMGVKDLGR